MLTDSIVIVIASASALFIQGIETVRRDGCPLLVKMLEKVLRILFTTKDLSQVKGYLYRQWTRILTDRAAVGDFIFAKEVRRRMGRNTLERTI